MVIEEVPFVGGVRRRNVMRTALATEDMRETNEQGRERMVTGKLF